MEYIIPPAFGIEYDIERHLEKYIHSRRVILTFVFLSSSVLSICLESAREIFGIGRNIAKQGDLLSI